MTMMSSSSVIPIDNSVSIRLRIVASAQFGAHTRWEAQLALLRRCANYDGNGIWYRWIDGRHLTGPELDPLWEAVGEYGTGVSVDAIRHLPPPHPDLE